MDEGQIGANAVVIRLLCALLTKGSRVSEGAPVLASLGVGYADIAVVFGSSEATVRSIVSKARRGVSAKPVAE